MTFLFVLVLVDVLSFFLLFFFFFLFFFFSFLSSFELLCTQNCECITGSDIELMMWQINGLPCVFLSLCSAFPHSVRLLLVLSVVWVSAEGGTSVTELWSKLGLFWDSVSNFKVAHKQIWSRWCATLEAIHVSCTCSHQPFMLMKINQNTMWFVMKTHTHTHTHTHQ